MPRAIIFDVDGTLAETEGAGHRVAFNEAFAEAGLDWRWDSELYGELLRVAGGKERIRHYCERFAPTFLDRPDATAIIAGLHAAKTRRYGAMLREGRISLRSGVAELIAEARAAGVTLAIATTTAPENVTGLLTSTLGPEAPGWFAAIGAGDIVPAKKPAPDIYLCVLERLGLPANACLAVEDSAIGLAAATAAGIPTIVTPSAYTGDDDVSASLAVVPDLAGTTLTDLTGLLRAVTTH